MKVVSKIALPAFLLSMSLAIVAAQAPAQEPITELQWQRAGRAFMSGLYPHAGAGSFVNQLAPDVARDIVKMAKPVEKYGFIKNFTDKPIVRFGLGDPRMPHICTHIIIKLNGTGDIGDKGLSPHCQWRFIFNGAVAGAYGIVVVNGYREQVWPQAENGLFNLYNISIQFDDEDRLTIKNVHCFDLMNIKIYREGQRVRLEVTAPNRTTFNYYAESIPSKRR